jgi:hypothetical protein
MPMKFKLLKMWNGNPAGRVLDLGAGQIQLLVARGIGVVVSELPGDKDGDGRAEGGAKGDNKAFTKPPAAKATKRNG